MATDCLGSSNSSIGGGARKFSSVFEQFESQMSFPEQRCALHDQNILTLTFSTPLLTWIERTRTPILYNSRAVQLHSLLPMLKKLRRCKHWNSLGFLRKANRSCIRSLKYKLWMWCKAQMSRSRPIVRRWRHHVRTCRVLTSPQRRQNYTWQTWHVPKTKTIKQLSSLRNNPPCRRTHHLVTKLKTRLQLLPIQNAQVNWHLRMQHWLACQWTL